MAIIDVLTLGSRISFETYPAAIIGTTFNNVRVDAILDFETASTLLDVAAMHANVYPTLPSGTADDYKGYYYAKLRLENGKVTVVGLPWIKEDTVITQSTVNLPVTVLSVNPVDQARFKAVCAANGFAIQVGTPT